MRHTLESEIPLHLLTLSLPPANRLVLSLASVLLPASDEPALQTIRRALPNSTSVLLWADPKVLDRRLAARHSGDAAEQARRVESRRQEFSDLLAASCPLDIDIVFDNAQAGVDAAALRFIQVLHGWTQQGRPAGRDAARALLLAAKATGRISKQLKNTPDCITFT